MTKEANQALFGLETEYIVQVADPEFSDVTPSSGRVLRSTEVRGLLNHIEKPQGLYMAGDFLSNGARLYNDDGMAEYSSAEARTAKEAVAGDYAGEIIVMEVAQNAIADGYYSKVDINKRVTPHDGSHDVSMGRHENYLVERQYHPKENPAAYLAYKWHLATRCLYTGAGGITFSGFPDEQPVFTIAQKIPRLSDEFGDTTYGRASKPLISVRDEALADPKKYARVHVTSGDAPMSPWADRMQIGTTRLVLELARHADLDVSPLMALSDDVLAGAHHTARDLTMEAPLSTVDGSHMTAWDVQAILYEMVVNTLPESELTEEDRWTLTEWRKVLDDLAISSNNVLDRVEWPLKKRRMDALSDAADIALLDRRWDSLDPRKSIGLMLRQKLWRPWMPEESLIHDRVLNPPADTRAKVRGEVVRMAVEHDLQSRDPNLEIRWNYIRMSWGNNSTRRYNMAPFQNTQPRLLAAALGRLLHKR